MNHKFLTVGQVADALKFAPRTICRWFDKGILSGHLVPSSNHRRISTRSMYQLAERLGISIDHIKPKRASPCKTGKRTKTRG